MKTHEIKLLFWVDEEIFDQFALSLIVVSHREMQLRQIEIQRQIKLEKLKQSAQKKIYLQFKRRTLKGIALCK